MIGLENEYHMSLTESLLLGLLHLSDANAESLKSSATELACQLIPQGLGAFQDALISLEEKELVDVQLSFDGARKRKLYSLNQSGREQFSYWLRTSLETEELIYSLELRIFFFGLIPLEQQLEQAEVFVEQLTHSAEELETHLLSFQDENSHRVYPERYANIPRFQAASLHMRIARYRHQANWIKTELIDKELSEQ